MLVQPYNPNMQDPKNAEASLVTWQDWSRPGVVYENPILNKNPNQNQAKPKQIKPKQNKAC